MTTAQLKRRLDRIDPEAEAGPFCDCPVTGNPYHVILSWGPEEPDPGPCPKCGRPPRAIYLSWGDDHDNNATQETA